MKKLFFLATLALSAACQNPQLESTEVRADQVAAPTMAGNEGPVTPLSPIPEDWETQHNARSLPGPEPRFPGGYWVPGPGPIVSKRPDPEANPALWMVAAETENGQVGEELHFTATLVGDLKLATGPITVHLNIGDLLENKVHAMFNDGRHNDGGAGDHVWGLTILIPRDTESTHATFTASAMMGATAIGIKKTIVTLRGGDFQIHNGFEGEDCRLDQPLPFPLDPVDCRKTRGINLKDGPWTLQGGWAGKEGKMDGQFGILLTESEGVLISPWLPGGSQLWFSTLTEGEFAGLEVALSRDGVAWEAHPYKVKPRAGTKAGLTAELELDSNFHGYIRWRLMGTGAVRVDGIRILMRVPPPLEA